MTEPEPKPIVEQRGPFTVLDREVRHKQFAMEFIADRVIRPDGTLGEFFWINFPQQAVLIFPLDNERNIYLTEEFTYATNRYLIEAAGGSMNPSENAEEAARRKVKEELGIEVDSIHQFATLGAITSRVNNITHLFLARVQSIGEAKPDSGEVIRLKRVPFDEACQMILDGRISTASVAAGIMMIRLLDESQKSVDSSGSPIIS